MTRLAAALGALLLVTACAGGEAHNDADVDFATEMIGHHADAILMANVTIGRDGLDPEIARLAEEIRVTQTKELDALSDRLAEWGEPVPETGFATGDGHTHEEQDHGADVEALTEATDADFERLWLEEMVAHHQGALRLTETVLSSGKDAEVADLAERIAIGQEAQVEQMRALRS